MKKWIKSIIGEAKFMLVSLCSSFKKLFKRFLDKPLDEKIVDFAITFFIVSLFPTLALLIFVTGISNENIDMSFSRTIIFHFIIGLISAFFYLHFMEFFIVLSIGGVSMFISDFMKNIKKRISEDLVVAY